MVKGVDRKCVKFKKKICGNSNLGDNIVLNERIVACYISIVVIIILVLIIVIVVLAILDNQKYKLF